MERSNSLLRLAATGIAVLLLVAGGIIAGARLWPQVVTVEKHVVAPIRVGRQTPSPEEALPDLVDAACPAIVRLLTAPVPVEAPAAVPVSTRRKGRRHRERAPIIAAPIPAPLPLDGVIVSTDGYVVTSAERIAAAPGPVTALLADGRRLAAAPVAADPVSGIALLKLDADGLPFLPFADEAPRLGGWAFGLSSPEGTGCRVRTTTISSDGVTEAAPLRSYRRVTPADVVEAEGAPTLDAAGHVIALAVYRSAEEAATPELLLPGDLAHRVIDEIVRLGKPPPRPFGLLAGDLDAVTATRLDADRQRGAVILMVLPGSPADRAGLHAADVVVSAGGGAVSGASELNRALDPDADAVTIQVVRQRQRLSLTITP